MPIILELPSSCFRKTAYNGGGPDCVTECIHNSTVNISLQKASHIIFLC